MRRPSHSVLASLGPSAHRNDAEHRAVQRRHHPISLEEDAQKKCERGLAEAFQAVALPEVPTGEEEFNNYAAKFWAAWHRVLEKLVPTRRAWKLKLVLLAIHAMQTLLDHGTELECSREAIKGHHWTRYRPPRPATVIQDGQERNGDGWRHFVPCKGNTTRGVFQLAKMAKRLCQPKDKARIPPLDVHGTTYRTVQEKGTCLSNSM